MSGATATVRGDSIIARVDLARTGNAAFVGALTGTLRDALGVTVTSAAAPLGVYYTLSPRLAIPLQGIRAGSYTLTLEAATSRPDVAPRHLLRAPAVSSVVKVVIP
jgi:hypothetical protein